MLTGVTRVGEWLVRAAAGECTTVRARRAAVVRRAAAARAGLRTTMRYRTVCGTARDDVPIAMRVGAPAEVLGPLGEASAHAGTVGVARGASPTPSARRLRHARRRAGRREPAEGRRRRGSRTSPALGEKSSLDRRGRQPRVSGRERSSCLHVPKAHEWAQRYKSSQQPRRAYRRARQEAGAAGRRGTEGGRRGRSE